MGDDVQDSSYAMFPGKTSGCSVVYLHGSQQHLWALTDQQEAAGQSLVNSAGQ